MPERSMLEWLLIGVVIGVVARLLMPGRDPGGFVVSILAAIVGALLVGTLAQMLGWIGWANVLAAAIGAAILVLAYRLLVLRRTRR